MPTQVALSIGRAIEKEKNGGKPFKGWFCDSCQRNKSQRATGTMILPSQSSTGTSETTRTRHREPDVIELSSDEDTDTNAKSKQPTNRYTSVTSSSSTVNLDKYPPPPRAPALITKKVKAKSGAPPSRDRPGLKPSASMPPPAPPTGAPSWRKILGKKWCNLHSRIETGVRPKVANEDCD